MTLFLPPNRKVLFAPQTRKLLSPWKTGSKISWGKRAFFNSGLCIPFISTLGLKASWRKPESKALVGECSCFLILISTLFSVGKNRLSGPWPENTISILGAKNGLFSHRKRCAKSGFLSHVKKYQRGHEYRKCFFFTLKTMARKKKVIDFRVQKKNTKNEFRISILESEIVATQTERE